MNQLALHLRISGRVQGVWYRQSAKEQADTLGVGGWIKNLSDGRVEAMLVGEANAVRHLEAWLSIGPELANVADIEVEIVEQAEPLAGFVVK